MLEGGDAELSQRACTRSRQDGGTSCPPPPIPTGFVSFLQRNAGVGVLHFLARFPHAGTRPLASNFSRAFCASRSCRLLAAQGIGFIRRHLPARKQEGLQHPGAVRGCRSLSRMGQCPTRSGSKRQRSVIHCSLLSKQLFNSFKQMYLKGREGEKKKNRDL